MEKYNALQQKIKEKENKINFKHIDESKNLVIYGFGDASYKLDDKSIGGIFILMGSKNNNNVNPIFWKSKTIPQICHSAKDAESRNLLKLSDDSIYLADSISLLFKNVENFSRIPVKLYTDSRSTLESVASSKQVERKLMRNCISGLREFLINNEIESFFLVRWKELDSRYAD